MVFHQSPTVLVQSFLFALFEFHCPTTGQWSFRTPPHLHACTFKLEKKTSFLFAPPSLHYTSLQHVRQQWILKGPSVEPCQLSFPKLQFIGYVDIDAKTLWKRDFVDHSLKWVEHLYRIHHVEDLLPAKAPPVQKGLFDSPLSLWDTGPEPL